jgi:hypothetical protein
VTSVTALSLQKVRGLFDWASFALLQGRLVSE